MKRVGAHVSAAGGVSNAIPNAQEIGAKAFAFFVKNQRQWFAKPFSDEEAAKFSDLLTKSGIDLKYLLPHGSYLLNLGSPSEEAREKSIKSLVYEMDLCSRLDVTMLNIHPGSHLRAISEDECLDNVAHSINLAHEKNKDVKIVIENTAGQGSNIGYKIEHIQRIIEKVEDRDRVGFCIDTCHAFAAGYDLSTIDSSKHFFDRVNDLIGIEYLSGLHLNDSKCDLGSRKDRHASLGQGAIGLEVFKYIMNSEYFEDMPLILETVDPTIWGEEINLLYSLVE